MTPLQPGAEADAPPRRQDLADALAWVTFGAAVLAGSVGMDRLEDQDINPYTIPGLLPGLLGIAMTVFGALMAWRSWPPGPPAPRPRAAYGRVLLVILLCVGFAVGLVGHGIPFWAAAALFVAVSILVLERLGAARPLPARAVLTAALIGLCAGGGVTLVFQTLFLVRLP